MDARGGADRWRGPHTLKTSRRPAARVRVLAALVLALAVAGCLTTSTPSNGGTSAGPSSSAAASSSSQSTSAAVPAPFDRFTSNVQVRVEGDTVVIVSPSVPDHKSPYWPTDDSRYEAYNGNNANFRANPNHIAQQTVTYRIPLHPSPAATHQQTPLGPIGVALNGVPFFNQYAAGRQTLGAEKDSFDQYDGHPEMRNLYHYHLEPTALTARLGRDALLGFLLDGYPVYGPVKDGKTLTDADLDAEHGLTAATPEYPNGTYQYRFTAEAPYLNGDGFHGTPGTVTQG